MPPLTPLRLKPIYQHYLWGGRRFETVLGRILGDAPSYAESWEVADHPDGQSVVATGPLMGERLSTLVSRYGEDLLGRDPVPDPAGSRPRFPLLLKYLDAAQTLSVQVHPDDARAARLAPPDFGKTEAWVVLATDPGATIYAGLRPGVDRAALAAAVAEGRCESCLHPFQPQVGDCVFLPAGTVHALGAGLVVAEVQQASNVTYRLYDWGRPGPDGRPRHLHVAEALDAIDFARGPVEPVPPQPTARQGGERLVACEKFVLHRWRLAAPASIGGDSRFHILSVIAGAVEVAGDPAGRPLALGQTLLIPAAVGPVEMRPLGECTLLESRLP